MPRRPRAIVLGLLLIASMTSCNPGKPGASTAKADRNRKRPGLSDVGPVDPTKVVAEQLVYVPAYSHIATGDDAQPLNLAITLSVRNADPGRAIVLTRVDYFDSDGKLVRKFLDSALKVEPLASAEYFIKESDVGGGGSPSFVVKWVAEGPAVAPVVESVMIGTAGTQGISFTSPGRSIDSRLP